MADEHLEQPTESAAPAEPAWAEPPQAPPFPRADQPPAAAAPDDGDRALAAVAHVFGWITGVIILIVGQNRTAYVRFHALQALVFDLLMTLLGTVLGMVLSFGFMALAMGLPFLVLTANGEQNPSWLWAMTAMFALMFPCFGLMALVPLGLRIYAVVRAATGHLYAYPLIGRWLKPGP
jgi:uncharacterized membrane protein